MSKGKKLSSIVRKTELEEREAAKEKQQIDQVRSERESALKALQEEESLLEQKINELIKDRDLALQQGDAARSAAVSRYYHTTLEELECLKKKITEKELELNRASKRSDIASEEIGKARTERKQVEKLISAQVERDRVKSVAREEADLDDQNTSRKPRRK